MSLTRKKLVSTANDLFYHNGFHAVGLDQVLDRVGVTKTTFYNHFESKDDLVIAVLHERDRHELDEWVAYMNANGGQSPKRQILALFDLLEDWLASPDFRGCMFLKAVSEYPSPNDPVHKAALVHGQNLHREILSRARMGGAKNAEALADQLMLILTGAILSRHTSGEPDRARSAKAAAQVLADASIP